MPDEFAGSPDRGPPDAAVDPLIGRTVAGKFAVEKKLGQGAMGAVYRARQVALDKTVAIKVLHGDRASDASYVDRFRREAKAASRLDHPNSIRVFDFGQEPDGLLYLAMEYVEGRDLRALLSEIGPLDGPAVADIVAQVLAALAVAHDLGVLHRDLKPENIMLVRGQADDGHVVDVVKVCDFGIAKIVETPRAPGAGTGRRTTEGFIVGTPEYMSPEQARGEAIDGRSDLYSVGIVLYELLVGSAPFEADSSLGIVLKHLSDAPEPPSSRRPGVDAGLEAICLKALQKFPAHRFQSAREMRQAVREAIGASPASGRPSLILVPPRFSSGRPYRPTLEAPKSTLQGVTPLAAAPVKHSRSWMVTAAIATMISFAGAIVVMGRNGAPPPHVTKALLEAMPTHAGPPSPAVVPEPREPKTMATEPAPEMATEPASIRPTPAIDHAGMHEGRTRRGKPATAANTLPASEPAPEETAPPEPAPPAAVTVAAAEVEIPSASAAAPMPSPATAVAPAPAAPSYDLGAARVDVALARNAIGATSSSVTRAVMEAMSQLNACYRTQLPRLTGTIEGAGTLHIETDGEGVITEARSVAPFDGDIGRCLSAAVSGRRVANVDTGSARADVPLTFRAR